MRILGASSIGAILAILLSILVLSVLFLPYESVLIGPFLPTSNATTTIISAANTTVPIQPVTTITQANVSEGNTTLYAYALSLINNDRQKYGLGNVTLSNEPSAQQHADSMLAQDYFSHWDTYGMKPYMRYTLLGGRGAVAENVAYQYSAACSILGCTGNINPKSSIQQMEYDMMYNDSQCCDNGHRYNILDANHTDVSVGVAYNSSTVYFVEDFENTYVSWKNYGPDAATYEMYLSGALPDSMSLSSILISYDSPVENMSKAQLAATSSYGYGTEVAGVVSSPLYYYPGLATITADHYSATGEQFSISFNLKNLIKSNGAGEYTVMLWLQRPGGADFLASTFTVFVASDGSIYFPSNV